MTIELLIARMTQDAQARIAAERARADAEISELAQAGAQASSREREATLAARRAARLNAFDLERAGAQRRCAARLLAAQHAFLDRVFARAESLAAEAAADPRYAQALPRQLATVVGYLGGRPAVLRCRPELAVQLQPLLADTPQIELVADATLPTGFVAAARDGSCTVDCTLKAQLVALRPQLEARLLSRGPR